MLTTLLHKIRVALKSHVCAYCAQPAPDAGRLFCESCRLNLGFRPAEPMAELPDFTGFAATHLNGATKKLIYGYKFYERFQDAPVLADVLIDYWKQCPGDPIHPENVAVIPIPAHGGKASHLVPIARRFARRFGYEFVPDALGWQRETQPQHLLEGRRARYDNVVGSMRAQAGLDNAWQHLIVIDDLTTTGATLQEAIRALQNARSTRRPRLTTLAISQVLLN